MSSSLKRMFFPPPELGTVDTSLRYMDILFGFVIKELFIRLKNWPDLPADVRTEVRWHLILGTVLVLGSWIGFRRSVNRPQYEVKFFNLPFLRFLIDQLMLILYFRIAVMTDADVMKVSATAELTTHTARLVATVFGLYLIWDLLGIWMARATMPGSVAGSAKPRYPKVVEKKATELFQATNWAGMLITATSFVVLVAFAWSDSGTPGCLSAVTLVVLLVYRFAKEVRTSWAAPT